MIMIVIHFATAVLSDRSVVNPNGFDGFCILLQDLNFSYHEKIYSVVQIFEFIFAPMDVIFLRKVF